MPLTPTLSIHGQDDPASAPPTIDHDEPFGIIVKKLSIYFNDNISAPCTIEQLRSTSAGNSLRTLVSELVANVTNPALIHAILTLKWHYSSQEYDDRGVNETRAIACEIVAWRFLTRISQRDAMDFCLYELPDPELADSVTPEQSNDHHDETLDSLEANERSSLISHHQVYHSPRPTPTRAFSKRLATQGSLRRNVSRAEYHLHMDDEDTPKPKIEDHTSSFIGLNALEIAAVADAKRFLSQSIVQKIIYGIWTGDITFWESLSVHTRKKAQFYNKRKSDPFTRLRVPRYIKTFEVLFFAVLLALYYAVLVERHPQRITPLEILLYIWIAAFAYDEMSEFVDAGQFYYTDFWSSWDLAIIGIGLAFFITRIIGVHQDNNAIVNIAFDILSLEAVFLLPRTFSLLSLSPYFGVLVPCLKAMFKDFLKFMVVVLILSAGFFTTFVMLARDSFTPGQMSWILIRVFFGSSYIGFDVMDEISPAFGPPLMLIFVVLTNILLITTLISILSNSFAKVVAHAREEYLYVYSVYVLEASTSNRLTHFYPPLNLIPLVLVRPLRLILDTEQLRSLRIIVLKITHSPIVGIIYLYERLHDRVYGTSHTFGSIGPSASNTRRVQKPTLQNRDSLVSISPRVTRTPSRSAPAKDSERDEGGDAPGLMKVFKTAVGQTGSEERESIQNQLNDLSAKIDELTALLMVQQNQTGNGGFE